MNRMKGSFHGRKQQRGMGLLDMAIWLVIVAGVAAFIFYLVGVIQGRRASADEAQNLNLMMTDTRTKFGEQGSFNGVSPQVLIQLGVVPKSMINGANIRSKWNTDVAVAAVALHGAAGDGIEFTYTLPRENCAEFVTAGAGSAARVTVGGTVVKNIPGGINTLQTATLGTSCDANAGGNVAVAFAQGR